MAPKKTASTSAPHELPGHEIGAAIKHWEALFEYVRSAAQGSRAVWKTYAGKTGTQCVIRGKDRNLAYLKPGDGSFLVSIALSDNALADLKTSKLPKALIAEIMAAPKYPEGTPARVRVDSEQSLKHALALLSIKITHTGKANPRRQ